MKFQTKTVHAGIAPDPATGAVVTPIYQSNIYAFDGIGEDKGYQYARMLNPNVKVLEDNLASLEGGLYCKVFSNGLAAETTLLNLLHKGDHIICGNDVYGGTIRLMNYMMEHFGIEVSYVPMHVPGSVSAALSQDTKLLWIETPSNPLMTIVDIQAMASLAREKGILTVVDNTLMTPYYQRPLELGADIVLHSASKYLSGHNDVLGGVIVTSNEDVAERLTFLVKALGTIANPFQSWLILRGLKTLAVRMREHEKNAMKMAAFLKEQAIVERVFYPGLSSHPQYGLIGRQMTGAGGLISFEVNGGADMVNKIMKKSELFYISQSFGGVESIIEHPKTMSHASMSAEAQAEAGITDGLIRLSVGLEDGEDLVQDLARAIQG